ncbi:MAG TPA: hypothetical protein VMR80_10590 [Candidatus Acidoferrum sp.]|nr:hypothetical protein [Candidatus Acidoferrum sp.]
MAAWQRYCAPTQWHETANLLPLMRAEELEALTHDIRAKGLQNPVVLFGGKVLDGRNRLLACAKANVAPTFTRFHENGLSALDFVITQNLHRRDLTFDQRVALAARLVPALAKQARLRKGGRPLKGEKPSATVRGVFGKAAAHAAQTTGVSTRSVEKAIALERKCPGTLAAMLDREMTLQQADKKVNSRGELAVRFGAPPFSVLDARQGYWQERKRAWETLGIKGEDGRPEQTNSTFGFGMPLPRTSVCDPVLCEIMYRWFAPKRGRILDPFAGGSTRGIVAAHLGYDYTGIEIRAEQVAANRKQAKKIGVAASWICGDSAKLSNHVRRRYDLIFTSPPYYDLEVYGDNKKDGSTLRSYPQFMAWYEGVFRQAVGRLKENRFLIVKVGEIRDEQGYYRNFVGDNVSCFMRLGLHFYNEAILVTPAGSLPLRVAEAQFTHYRKLGKGHQNVLIFYKGQNHRAIPDGLGILRE